MSLTNRLINNRNEKRAAKDHPWSLFVLSPELKEVLAFRKAVGLPAFTGQEDAVFETEAHQAIHFRRAIRRSRPDQELYSEKRSRGMAIG